MRTVYCKYSNDREDRFQIKTMIREDKEGKRRVYKYAMNREARKHIEKVYEHYLELSESYSGSVFAPNQCEKMEDGICLEYVEGKTLEEYLDELYLENRYMELLEKIKEYRDILYGMKDNIPFVYTEEFEQVFGRDTNFFGCSSLKISNIDLIFGNVILGDRWTVIDYEWVFDFPVPIDYIIYRALYYYVHGNTKRTELIKLHIFRLLGISAGEMEVYAQMEKNFQRYVAGNGATISGLKEIMLKKREVVLEREGEERTDFIQIYFDYGDGYREENSVKKYYNYSDGIVKTEYKIEEKVCGLRIDPAFSEVLVCDLSVRIGDVEQKVQQTNGIEVGKGIWIFETPEPQIVLNHVYSDTVLEVSFCVAFLNPVWKNCLRQILEEKREYQENLLQLREQQKLAVLTEQKLQEEMRHVCEHRNQLVAANDEMSAYIQRIRRRFTWRFFSLSKKTLKSLKQSGIRITLKKATKKVRKKVFKEGNKIPETQTCTGVLSDGAAAEFPKARRADKEKILVVVHEAQRAGATLLSINIIKTIKAVSEYEPVILLLAGGPLAEQIRRLGECYELNQPNYLQIYDKAGFDQIVEKFVEMGVRYALCNSVVTGIVLPGLKEKDIRTITMIHELPTSIETYHFTDAAHMVQKYSDDIVFAAEFVKARYIEKFPVDEKKCHVIPQGCYSKFNSLTFQDKTRNKGLLCEKLGVKSSAKIIMGCGYGNFRKGLDWFGSIAIQMMEQREDVHFLWLGNVDEEFRTWIDNDLMVKRLDDRFHWMDHIENPGYVFGGADVFLLTSREDPFPSVVLEAMKQYTPVIAFEGAGGIPEILTEGRGICVNYGDCKAMADEIFKLFENRLSYQSIVQRAKEYVKEITPRNYVIRLLQVLTEETARLKKLPDVRVSVVVPNYNYERYLPDRLSCVLNQTIQPYEVIFLDDVSSDDSVTVAREILKNSGIRYQIIENTENQGCFNQWLRGVRQAEGEIIWIAEADDLCELDFIERLLPFFEDEQVNLAYAQSEVIYEDDEYSGYIYTEYTRDLNADKWNQDYVNNGEAEIIDGLGIKNTIPNASGTLMRKSAFAGIDRELSQFAVSGDWFVYVYLIKTGKIAFCSDVLNYHRRHKSSIIHQSEQNVQLFVELLKVKQFIADNFLIPESIAEWFLNHVQNEYKRLMPKEAVPFSEKKELSLLQRSVEKAVRERLQTYHFLCNMPQKRLLFVIPDFEMGGGQTLVVRLANYFSKFHQVFVYNARPWLCEERIIRMFSEKVVLLESHGDPKELRRYIQEYQIETINDHIWWSDKMVYKAVGDLDTRVVLSMHGCYEALLQNPEWDSEFQLLAPAILKRANEIIYATDKNKKIFETVPVEGKIHQIYYGYERESIPPKERRSLGIEESSFVFGLVARGIKEKGFGEAAAAFKKLKAKYSVEMDLILVGNGPFIDELKEKYAEEKTIHFVDNLKKPSEWIGWVKTFNCAMLPTYFVSESLPNSVIEYLAYGVPVISTNIGDIRYMLRDGRGNEAGILLELHDGQVDTDELAEAMSVMLTDKAAYQKYKDGSAALFDRFDMRNFAEKYYLLYEGILTKNGSPQV